MRHASSFLLSRQIEQFFFQNAEILKAVSLVNILKQRLALFKKARTENEIVTKESFQICKEIVFAWKCFTEGEKEATFIEMNQ